ncbi:MAG: hypothetical protein WCX65_03095 [bacterium]
MNSETLTEALADFLIKVGDDDYKGKIYVVENKKYRKWEANWR